MPINFRNGAQWLITPDAMGMIHKAMPQIMNPSAGPLTGNGGLSESPMTVQNGVAIIPITGTITKSGGLLSFLFGGSSVDGIRRMLLEAEADPNVKAIVTYFDTPGGTVTGIHELAADISRVNGQKPVVAYSDGMMCSAGYYLAAPASKILISPMAEVGSVGVMACHYDFSQQDEFDGLKRTFLYAGKFKTIGNDAEPLTSEARMIIETHLQQTYDVFVGAVSKYRNTPEEKVRADMAEGRMFIGQAALDAGLADGLGSLDDAVALALSMTADQPVYYSNKQPMQKEAIMPGKNEPVTIGTVEDMRAAFPDLCQKMISDAMAGIDLQNQRTEAASAEQARIMGLADVHFGPDAGKKFSAIVSGGVTVDQYMAMAEALAGVQGNVDAGLKKTMLEKIENAGAADPGAGGAAEGPKTFQDAVQVIMDEKKISRARAMSSAVSLYPDLHQAFIKAANPKLQSK